MQPTRRSQPYRATQSRPPSPTLDKMRAGGQSPSTPKTPLAQALAAARGTRSGGAQRHRPRV